MISSPPSGGRYQVTDGATELDAMKAAYEALKDLNADQQRRAVGWLIDTLGVQGAGSPPAAEQPLLSHPPPLGEGAPVGATGADVTALTKQTPRQFIATKRPANTAERLTCLAYYSTYARSTPSFKAPDLVALNTEAAGPRIANPSRDIDNCERGSGYLVGAGGGARQISARGEALVNALPDREAVKEALAEHRHWRRATKAAAKASPAKKAGPAKKAAARKATLPRP